MLNQNLSNQELVLNLENLVKSERKITLTILDYFREVERRKCFAEFGFSSLFEFAIKYLKYSESAACRRITAMRLIKNCKDEVTPAIQNGEISLTSLSLVSQYVRSLEKHEERKVSEAEKKLIINEIKGKNTKEVTKVLLEKSLDKKIPPKESVRDIANEMTTLNFTISQETKNKLEKVKAIFSNKNISDLNDIFDELLDQVIKNDELQKKIKPRNQTSTSVTEVKTRYVSAHVKRELYKRAQGTCEYISPLTGLRCNSKFYLQISHKLAYSKGGKQNLENLKLCCRNHNMFEANIEFGTDFMEKKKGLAYVSL